MRFKYLLPMDGVFENKTDVINCKGYFNPAIRVYIK